MSAVTGREPRAAAILVSPALGAIVAFFLLPVLAALALSVTDFDIYALADPANLRFVGMRNYARLLADPTFRTALWNTTSFVVVAAPLSIAVSLGAALLVDARLARGAAFHRTVLFLPVVTTLVAAAVVWRYLYHPRFGLLNHALAFVGVGPVDWLGDPRWAMPAIVFMTVWKTFGFNMVIFVAGLRSISPRLYEAASLDGAGPLATFRHVTLPQLAPTTAFVTLMTVIGDFQLFAEPYVMTQGGPGDSTLSVVLLMYREGFRWWNLGTAAATAFVLFVIILALSALGVALRRGAPDAPAGPGGAS
ncbi:MAG: sugar ABC transporter permease [Deltaproteobacteria bacterium]|nr:sugar ABC transporter permease [Deltaproteobacteria bacterium]